MPPLPCIFMQETRIDINGLSLCITTEGNPLYPPLLILHGWLDHAGSWSLVASQLAKQYYVIIPDQRGHGKSDHVSLSSHYHFPDYVADLQSIIDHYNLRDFILIGHSMGGTVASLYSALGKNPPKKLVLIEGLGPAHESNSLAKLRYQQHLAQRASPSSHSTMPSMAIAAQKIRRTHPFISEEWSLQLAERLVLRTKDPTGYQWRWDPRHKHKAAIAFHLPRHLEILSHIHPPTTLLFGSDSWYTTLPDLQDRIRAFSCPVDIHYLSSGHSPHLQCPDDLTSLLLEIILS